MSQHDRLYASTIIASTTFATALNRPADRLAPAHMDIPRTFLRGTVEWTSIGIRSGHYSAPSATVRRIRETWSRADMLTRVAYVVEGYDGAYQSLRTFGSLPTPFLAICVAEWDSTAEERGETAPIAPCAVCGGADALLCSCGRPTERGASLPSLVWHVVVLVGIFALVVHSMLSPTAPSTECHGAPTACALAATLSTSTTTGDSRH